ncbi:MAG: glutathione S-transferase family protein [Pseudomonadota bacterium]
MAERIHYYGVEEARDISGLRLVLTRGVPGPWGEAAKAVLRARRVPFIAVEQRAGEANEALTEWTGMRNAPIAIYNDEAPRSGYQDILMLAERLGEGPSLLPDDPADRFKVLGIASDICGPYGFGWSVRLLLFQQIYGPPPIDASLPPAQHQLCALYGFTPDAVTTAARDAAAHLKRLAQCLAQSQSGYLVGDQLTAADLYWAVFSMIIDPLADEVNPMPGQLRGLYDCENQTVLDAYAPELTVHRDRIYKEHIGLPLDF